MERRTTKAFAVLKPHLPYSYNETNKVLSQLSGVPLKTCLPSTRAAYSEMCPIKGLTRLKQLHCRGTARRRLFQFYCL